LISQSRGLGDVYKRQSKQFVKKGDSYYREGGYPSNDSIAKWLKTQAPADVIINTQLFDNVDFVKDHVHLDSDAHTQIANEWKTEALNLAAPDFDDITTDKINVLSYGDSGPEVKEMQRRLMSLGYNVGSHKDDGKFGPDTEAGLKAFQRDSGLEVSGIYDSATQSRLYAKSMGAPVYDTKKSDTSLKSLLRGVIGIDANYDSTVETQAADILRQFEGLSYTPYWDVNNWRIGYGSSTVTDASGKVTMLSDDKSKKPTITITDEDAERDLSRRLNKEFIPKVMNSIGSVDLPDGAIAALVSVCYNYGSLPASVKEAARTGNLEKLARSVYNLRKHNGGILAKRRKAEASYILNSK
jgi:GH24 family phage-related lysozyme (muramidase)